MTTASYYGLLETDTVSNHVLYLLSPSFFCLFFLYVSSYSVTLISPLPFFLTAFLKIFLYGRLLSCQILRLRSWRITSIRKMRPNSVQGSVDHFPWSLFTPTSLPPSILSDGSLWSQPKTIYGSSTGQLIWDEFLSTLYFVLWVR